MIYITLWMFFLVRLVLYSILGLLRFISKPGSRIIVPMMSVFVCYFIRLPLHGLLTMQIHRLDPTYQPESFILDGVMVICMVLLIVFYIVASRAIAVLIGAFPVPMRPLPPQRRLKPTKVKISPAAVRIVVPPLPTMRRSRIPRLKRSSAVLASLIAFASPIHAAAELAACPFPAISQKW